MENENKKLPQVIIIGAGPEDKIGTGQIALYIASLKQTHEIIFVDSIGEIKDKTGWDVDIDKLNTLTTKEIENIHNNKKIFDNPSIIIENLPKMEIPFIDFKEHNPWPTPKGNRGKRKW